MFQKQYQTQAYNYSYEVVVASNYKALYQNRCIFCRYGPSLLWAEFVWDDLVMGRVCNGPSLLWAEMSSYRCEQE